MGIFGAKKKPAADEPYTPNPDPIYGELNPALTAPMPQKKRGLLGGLGKVLQTAGEVAAFGPFTGMVREQRALNAEERQANAAYKHALAQKMAAGDDEATTQMRNAGAMGLQPGTPEYADYIRQVTMAPALPQGMLLGPDGKPQMIPGYMTPEDKEAALAERQARQMQAAEARFYASQAASEGRQAETINNQWAMMQAREAIDAQRRGVERIASTRKEFDDRDEVKAYRTSVPVLASAAKAPKTAAGDLDLIYAMGKIMDPNSVVREGELALAGGSGSWEERLKGMVAKGTGNGPGLPPAMRQRLIQTLAGRVAQQAQAYNMARKQYGTYAKSLGLPDSEVLGMHPGDQLVNQGLARRSGSGLARPAPKKAPTPTKGPKPGIVENGYRFKGGNPADPKAWEKVS